MAGLVPPAEKPDNIANLLGFLRPARDSWERHIYYDIRLKSLTFPRGLMPAGHQHKKLYGREERTGCKHIK